ncbi:MAG TPA: CHASE3 domain-containing protein [Gemmatimonadaceae bacterium]|nr:CHASE3 domain-containing protein [Gemmatimonadaceae bacterium]
MHIPHSRPILVSFGLASTAIVMCALLLLEWKDGTAATESFGWVSHTLEIQRELATVEARMSEAQSGERGYILTGQPAFLGPYATATNEVRTRLANLRLLLEDNPGHLRRLIGIESLSRAKLAEFDSTIKLERAGQHALAVSVVKTPHSDSLMTSIRSSLQRLTADEASLLRDRQQMLVSELHRGDLISLGLAAALAVMLISLLVLARGAEHYRNLVTLCAWTRSVEYEGEWISFEEYLRRKFDIPTTHGISPDALSQIEVGLDERNSPDALAEIEIGLDEPQKS